MKIGVVGLGGLGHMAVKWGKAFGCEVRCSEARLSALLLGSLGGAGGAPAGAPLPLDPKPCFKRCPGRRSP